MSTSWNKLIHQLEELQIKFNKAVQALDASQVEKPGVCGHWSPKQLVAHMTGWEIETILQFQRIQNGLEAIEHDIDAFNEKSVDQRSHLTWNETLTELITVQNRLNEVIRSTPKDDHSKNIEYRELMDVQIEHYIHHTKQLESWS